MSLAARQKDLIGAPSHPVEMRCSVVMHDLGSDERDRILRARIVSMHDDQFEQLTSLEVVRRVDLKDIKQLD